MFTILIGNVNFTLLLISVELLNLFQLKESDKLYKKITHIIG